MKLRSMKIRGIGSFNTEREVVIPFDQLDDARLIAIKGPNGVGKTTALECFPGALYRETPSKGLIASLANRKDSLIEIEVETDQVYRAQLQIDATVKHPKTVAYLFDAAGEPLTNGKIKDYDAAIAERFPGMNLLLSSVFAAQGGEGGFFDLQAADRKTLFVKMLGQGHLWDMAKAAGEHARATEIEVARLRERETHLSELSAEHGEIREHHANTKQQLADVRDQIKSAEESLANSTRDRGRWTELRAELQRAEQEARHALDGATVGLQHARKDAEQAGQRRAELDLQIADNEHRMEEHEFLAETAATVPALESSVERLEQQLTDVRAEQERYHKARDAWIERGQEMKATAERLRREWETSRDNALDAVAQVDKQIERAQQDTNQLNDVPCGGEEEYATCPLIRSAAQARDSLPDLATKWGVLNDASMALEQVPGEVLDAESAIDDLRKIGPEEPGSSAVVEAALDDDRRRLNDARQAATRLEALADISEQLVKLRVERAMADSGIDDMRDHLDEAAARVTVARLNACQSSEDFVGVCATAPAEPDTSIMSGLRDKEIVLVGRVSGILANLEAAGQAEHDLGQVRGQVKATVADLDDWKHLRRALGKDGIQALEVDAAGPEVSDLTNELLHSCYGTRFTISLETTAMRADGKGTKEVFDIRVIDTKNGIELEARLLSGGEKVLVSEAMSLAIAIFNSQRSSMPMLDLFRDECSGALYPETAPLYIEMLRRALDLGGFHRCYFISHQPELWGLADKQIVFSGDDIRVEQ